MLRVADMERTLQFYCGRLGMNVVMDRTDADGYRNVFVAFTGGGARIEFGMRPSVRPNVAAGNGFDHIALETPDVAAAVARLRDEGVAIVREVKRAQSGALIALITDPDGYRIELIQPAEGTVG